MNENKSENTAASGKEIAKINARKKFYSKFDHLCQRIENTTAIPPKILLSLGNKSVFPKFDEFSKLLENHSQKLDENIIQLADLESLSLPYIDDVEFILKVEKLAITKVYRQESLIDEAGNQLKNLAKRNESTINYQESYSWIIEILKLKELREQLAIEMENPTQYVKEVKSQSYDDTFTRKRYHKDYKVIRRRR